MSSYQDFYAKFAAPLPTALWVSENPYLAEFVFGEESDGGRGIKLGPGYWNDLTYFTARVQRSYLTEDVVYNNVDTLADIVFGDDDMPFGGNLVSGGIYAIELTVQSTAAVRALLMDFGGTASIANFTGTWRAVNADTVAVAVFVSAAGTDPDFSPLDGAFDSLYTFQGSMEIGPNIEDAGTFLLRGAQNVADASDTTILRGSTMILTQMN